MAKVAEYEGIVLDDGHLSLPELKGYVMEVATVG